MNPIPGSLLGIQSGPLGQSTINLRRLIAWGDHYKVDQPQPDAQHEEIFDVALEVCDIWQRRGDLQRLKDLADKLASVLAAHFEYEEKQFVGIAYAHCAEHCEEHQVMLDELKTIRKRLEAMGPGRVRSGPGFLVLGYVLGLTVGHLTHSDMDALPARHVPA
ncbi:MAG: hemerythrin family protein [Burkholderiaceae bacterium]|jgi:hemerythrin-like metal-binding protein|nr:hemerythrin family protein [Burkholderiaceae bacterium]